WLNVLRACCY
ncbi:DEAD/DEAH box helicase family protein, partial [Vibrio parahaemolyticus V-223/04]